LEGNGSFHHFHPWVSSRCSLSSHLHLSLLPFTIHIIPHYRNTVSYPSNKYSGRIAVVLDGSSSICTSSHDVTALYRLKHPTLRLLATPSHTYIWCDLTLDRGGGRCWKLATNGATVRLQLQATKTASIYTNSSDHNLSFSLGICALVRRLYGKTAQPLTHFAECNKIYQLNVQGGSRNRPFGRMIHPLHFWTIQPGSFLSQQILKQQAAYVYCIINITSFYIRRYLYFLNIWPSVKTKWRSYVTVSSVNIAIFSKMQNRVPGKKLIKPTAQLQISTTTAATTTTDNAAIFMWRSR
jgi:hypothetical protein